MKLYVFTLALNAMPWLPCIYTTLNRLMIPWQWIVVEGTAMNTHCSAHCQPQEPGLSTDGTLEFLSALVKTDSRVTVLSSPCWDGKIAMVNAAVAQIKEQCVLIQMDSDEVWMHKTILNAFGEINGCSIPIGLNLRCRYFVGPGLVACSPAASGTDMTAWVRAWAYKPGQKFKSHCPPVLENITAARSDLSFDHYAYVLEKQVRAKQRYYGFSGMLDGWNRLQVQQEFPVLLRDFWPYPWVDTGTMVHKL